MSSGAGIYFDGVTSARREVVVELASGRPENFQSGRKIVGRVALQ